MKSDDKNSFNDSSNQDTISFEETLGIQTNYISIENETNNQFNALMSEFKIESETGVADNLWKLYQQETSFLSAIKWSSIDHYGLVYYQLHSSNPL